MNTIYLAPADYSDLNQRVEVAKASAIAILVAKLRKVYREHGIRYKDVRCGRLRHIDDTKI